MTEFCLIMLISLGFVLTVVIFAAANEAYAAKPGHRIEAVLNFFDNLMEWR